MDYSEGDSWSETIRNYKYTKVNLPWDPAKEGPVKRVTEAHMKQKSRAFDPILQQHRDPVKESTLRQHETTQSMQQLNRARDRQLRHVQTYDPLTHIPRVQEPPPKPRYTRTTDTKVQYNILSNLDFTQHHWAPPEKRPDVKEQPPRFSKNFISYAFEKRDFNVLTNKYHEDHEEKVAVDKEVALNRAADRYWKTHNYDPIRGTYFDKAKEKDFRRKRFEESLVHGKDVASRWPAGIREREGAAHDIVTNTVKDPTLAEKIDRSSGRAKITRIRDKRDEEVRNTTQHLEMKKSQQAINRVAHTRFEEQKKHGYNVVSNQPFYGVNKSSLGTFQPATSPSPSVWDKIQREHHMTTTDLLGTASLGASHPSPFHPAKTGSMTHQRSRQSSGRPPLSASSSQPALKSQRSEGRGHRSDAKTEITDGARSVLSSGSFTSQISNPLQPRPSSQGGSTVVSRGSRGSGVRTGGFR